MNRDTPLQGSGESAPKRHSKAPLIISLVVGGVLILGAVGAAAAVGIRSLSSGAQPAQQLTADARALTELDVYVAAAEFEIRFDAGADARGEATLETTEGGQSWTLDRRGDTLVVDTKRGFFNWGWNLLGPGVQGQQVVLILPESLRGDLIDADMELAVGSLRVDGDFGELDLEVSGGSARVDGSARSVSASVSAGEAQLDLSDVAQFEFEASAGELTAELRGDAPTRVQGSVSAGEARITLPDELYNVSVETAAGSVVNDLRTSSESKRLVSVEVSAGDVFLKPAR